MKIRSISEKSNTPIVLALGFFDCIHNGHAELIKNTVRYASIYGAQSALFTFRNDPNVFFGHEKQMYSFIERADALSSLGLDELLYADFDTAFANVSPYEFLDMITDNAPIKHIVVGSDYTFGKNAEGNVNGLIEYCDKKDITVEVVPFVLADGKKLSTSDLKNLVKSGNVSDLNKYLSQPYFMLGDVLHAKHNGTRIGFPTANIAPDKTRLELAQGIYATRIQIDGMLYDAMSNVGAKPTFGDESYTVETFIFDFNGDIYGKSVKLQFICRTRDVTRFSSPEALKQQLTKDELQIKAILKTAYKK